jgi:ABC-type Mn2+/Zn2+ transport system ATPase subunit
MIDDTNAVPALAVEDLSVEFDRTPVLEHVSFAAERGELLGVVGPNGGGKSTLFNSIVGLVPVQQGRILVYGQPPNQARGVLAYVPQREQINWRFPLTAWDVVMLGRSRKIGWLRKPGRRDREYVEQCLERVGMIHRRSSLVSELSGGQRQRVFVARALAQEADILLLDEAFSGVDVASQEGLVTVLRGLRNEGKTIIMATHDLTNLSDRFDEVLCLNRHVCAHGHPDEAFTPEVLHELYGAHGVVFGEGRSSNHRRARTESTC